MRWPIRNQILVPLLLIQGVAVAAIAAATAAFAARRSEAEILERLTGVVGTLGRANFPYTAGVLAQMRGLSGAHFVAYDPEGRAAESTLPAPIDPPPAPATRAPAAWPEALGRAPTIVVGGARHLAVALGPGPSRSGWSLLVLYPEARWRQARREAALPPLVLGAASLALMAGVTGLVAHGISDRLRRVERQVAAIAAGEFAALDAGRTRDEVSDLVRSVNRMGADLRRMRETAARTERARLLAQLAAGLAHQLRNAVTGARMSVQLHARRCPPPDDDQSLAVALRQLAMTEEHVRSLLSLGRPSRRGSSPCDLGRLVADVALLVDPSCRHAGVALAVEVEGEGEGGRPAPAPVVVGDGASLRSAVLNLALNAIEAAGPGGRVRLTAGSADGSAFVAVRDTGPGPPEALAGSLFEPFVTGKPEGVGLGLAVARQVAGEHGGALAWSRAAGETVFRLTFPLPAPAPEPEPEPEPEGVG